jgi:hypothetical protein
LPGPLVAGHCDLCRKPSARLCWDHDHVLEDLGFSLAECHRGWLCTNCNGWLGTLGDTPQGIRKKLARLQRALDYSRGQLPGQRDFST